MSQNSSWNNHTSNNYSRWCQQENNREARRDAGRPVQNTTEWDIDAEILWRSKPIEEVEAYYLNTKNCIARMKKSTRGKPRVLIEKKRKWRDGLYKILQAKSKAYSKLQQKTKPSSTPVMRSTSRTSDVAIRREDLPHWGVSSKEDSSDSEDVIVPETPPPQTQIDEEENENESPTL